MRRFLCAFLWLKPLTGIGCRRQKDPAAARSLPQGELRVSTGSTQEPSKRGRTKLLPPSARFPRAIYSCLLLIESFLGGAGSVCPRQTFSPLVSAS